MSCACSNILVTGGAGFIGSHIVNRLLVDGFEVTVVDNLSTGRLENLQRNERGDVHFIRGDIRDFDLMRRVVADMDVVFHEAASIDVASSLSDPLTTHSVNVTGTLNLLISCLDSSVKRLIFASSASIYGETDVLPTAEDTTPNPISPYAVSKLAAEDYANLFFKAYGLNTVCLRYFNVYGSRQGSNHYSGVIPIFINRVLHERPPVVYGNGEQTRDFVHVQDVVDANMLALRSKNAVGEVFNIGTGTPMSITQLAKIVLETLGKESLNPVYAGSRPGDLSASYADITKARRVMGYDPKVTLTEGIAELVRWHKQSAG